MGWIPYRTKRRNVVPAALLALTLGLASNNSAQAQCVASTVSNGVISASVGISGQPQGVTPQINCAGRIGMATAGTTNNVLLAMAASAANQSYITVRIDGGPSTPGVDTGDAAYNGGWDLIFGDAGSNQLDATTTNVKTDQGAWLQIPSVSGNTLTARWTTLPGASTGHPIPRIEVGLTITLVHDTAAFQFTVTNRDTAAHTVQIRFAQDYNVAGASDGPIVTTNQGNICTDTDLQGALIPSSWHAGNPANSTSVGAVLLQQGALVPPYRATFGGVTSTNFPIFDFVPNPANNICSGTLKDGGAGVYFNLGRIAPSGSATATTYFGKLTSTIDAGSPWAAGVEGPVTLTYDPTKPLGQQLQPNPFNVTAFMINQTQVTLTNASATITLPQPGLTLAPGETATKQLGNVAVGSEASASWQVVADGTASGRLTYSVSFSAGPGAQGKVVTRDIDIPALPIQNFTTGLQMVSFPYAFANPDPSVALGLSFGQFDLLRWNPAVNVYEAVSRIVPGEGYWMRLPQNTTISLVGASPITSAGQFEIKLLQGWNQIGNPFLTRVTWADLTVITTDVGDPNYLVPLSVQAAANAGLILPTIYWYDTATGGYRFDTSLSTELVPFQGYWVKSLKRNLSLLITQPTSRAARSRASAAPQAATGWKLRLQANTGKSQDSWNFIGVAGNAKDAFDLSDVEKPPFISGAVRLELTRDGWGSRAGSYAQDIQSQGGATKQWTMRVSTPAANQDVTVSWPEINSLPRGYELYITDTATGQRQAMRQVASVRVNTGDAASRSFVITAEQTTRTNGFALTLNLRGGRAGGAATIEVGSTQAASIGVKVKGANGQTIRTIGGRSASLGNSATYTWDLRDAKGSAVAAGTYLVEVTGTTPDGLSRKAAQPIIVVR